jgi:hypothetical protein
LGEGGDEATALGGPMRAAAVYILNEKFDFMLSTDFKLLSQIKANSLSYCDFLFIHNFFSRQAL